MLFRTPLKGSCYLKRPVMCYFKGPQTFGPSHLQKFLNFQPMRYKEEVKPSKATKPTMLIGGDVTDGKAAHFWSWGGHLHGACAERECSRHRAVGTHLTALTSADPIVVPWWFVLADEAGFVHARGRKWRRRARDEFLRAGALCFNCYDGEKTDFSSFRFHQWTHRPLPQIQP